MKQGYIRHKILRLLRAGVFALALGLSSCVAEDISDCEPTTGTWVKVVLFPNPGQESIDPSTVSDVKLYVFDTDEELLETRQTAIGRPEKIDYPGQEVTVVVLANVGNSQLASIPAVGDRLNTGKLSLKPAAAFNGHDIYNTTDDIIWGELRITEVRSRSNTIRTLDVPVRRITSAVYILIYGMDNYAARKGWNDGMSIDLNAIDKYNELNFRGEVSASATPIRYKPALVPVAGQSDVYEAPSRTSDKTFFNIFSTDDGAPVSLEFFNGSDPTPVYKAELDQNSRPILATNGKLCVIEIRFPDTVEGDVTIKVENPQWGYVPPITGEF